MHSSKKRNIAKETEDENSKDYFCNSPLRLLFSTAQQHFLCAALEIFNDYWTITLPNTYNIGHIQRRIARNLVRANYIFGNRYCQATHSDCDVTVVSAIAVICSLFVFHFVFRMVRSYFFCHSSRCLFPSIFEWTLISMQQKNANMLRACARIYSMRMWNSSLTFFVSNLTLSCMNHLE